MRGIGRAGKRLGVLGAGKHADKLLVFPLHRVDLVDSLEHEPRLIELRR